MLLGFPGEAADMGPSGVPEEDHASFHQHVGHRDQVPSPAVAGVEGILDLLSFVRGLVHHEFLGVVSSVGLFCHENLPFRVLSETSSISSPPNTGQGFSCPVSYSLDCRELEFSETDSQNRATLCAGTAAKWLLAPLEHPYEQAPCYTVA
jgi:hypothetical protein